MKFLISVKDRQGNSDTKTIDASSLADAVSIAQGQGLFVFNAQPLDGNVTGQKKTSAGFSSSRSFTHNGVSLQDSMSFARQLATMLSAGVPLLRSLVTIGQQVESRMLAEILEEVSQDVESGVPFSQAIAKHPRYFDQFWSSLIEVGEASGTLPQCLNKLSSYIEENAKFRSQIIGALVYPAILFMVAIGAICFFAFFIGPTFERIFKDMGTELPAFTLMLFAFFNFVKANILWIIGGMIGLFFLLKAYIKTPLGRYQFESFLFSLPGLSNLIKLIVIEKFSSQMALLIDSGVPIIAALDIAERLVDNMICAEVIMDIKSAVKEGSLIADPMARSGFFPSMAVQMVRVGEETGELGKMLNHVAVYYKENIENTMKNISTMVEPLMLVFMGGVIGTIVIGMFLPMFNMSG